MIRWLKSIWWRSSPRTIYRKLVGQFGHVTDEKGNTVAMIGQIDLATKKSKPLRFDVKNPYDVLPSKSEN